MDEAGAALDYLQPSAVLTYAEAGGWGRAIMLEARRRGITTIGAQHGFIYRHWLNYLHEPDEMAPSSGNASDAGFPRPTSTLLFDGFAEEHLRRNGHFPEGSVLIYDFLEGQETESGSTLEGPRRFTSVMVRDSNQSSV